MSDIRKRQGAKGTTYQVRFPCKSTKSGYAFKSFSSMKEARAYAAHCEVNAASNAQRIRRIKVDDAVALWLDICEKIGRDGRETVEPQTLVEYARRGKVISEYPWKKYIHELAPTDIIDFRTWLIETKSRDLARRCLSSFHSVILEMKLQGYTASDPAAGITIKSGGRHDEREVQIPSDNEMSDLFAAIDALALSPHAQRRAAWQRFKPMFYLAGFSGMRPSEYRGLPWDCIDGQTINVTQRADKNGVIGAVKSRAAKRTIIIPSLVADMLENWRELAEAHDSQLVFATAEGKPLLLNNIFYGGWKPLM